VADILLLGRDPDLVDHILALASAAELTVDVQSRAQPAALTWKRTPLVIVCTDLLAEAAVPRCRRGQALSSSGS
jgi:hypothetical protein